MMPHCQANFVILDQPRAGFTYRSWRLALLLTLIAFQPIQAGAQNKVRQVGVLSPFVNRDSLFFETLRQELTKLGYIEGKNIAYLHRQAESFDGLTKHANEMAKLKVELIITEGPQAVRAARNATNTIPIVMGNIGDAVDQGFVATLAKPGGNITGLSSLNADLSGKRLELLKDTLPALARVAVMREAAGDANPLRTIESAAQPLGLKLIVFQVREGDEIPSAFSAIGASHAGALQILPASMFVSRMRNLAELAQSARLPGIFPDARFVRSGGLMSYGPNVVDLYRRAAVFVDKIFKGSKPADLPVEQPTSFELVVNLKSAKALGIKISPSVLMRANQVIQ